jgi:hypothetical protein
MKHFLLEGEHLIPFEKRAQESITAHRKFFQDRYDKERFLLSGPGVPPLSGHRSENVKAYRRSVALRHSPAADDLSMLMSSRARNSRTKSTEFRQLRRLPHSIR